MHEFDSSFILPPSSFLFHLCCHLSNSPTYLPVTIGAAADVVAVKVVELGIRRPAVDVGHARAEVAEIVAEPAFDRIKEKLGIHLKPEALLAESQLEAAAVEERPGLDLD